MIKQTFFYISGFLLLLIALTALTGRCNFQNPIKVGFSAQFTGPHANMGVSGRDGVLLAIEEINANGGIAGRRVKLLVRDDKGTPQGAVTADRGLIDAGVVAIIGHMTSSQSMAALPMVEASGTILLSPTTSTPDLTGQIDHFFRVVYDSTLEARYLARHVINTLGIGRVSAIYDQDNAAYTGNYLNAFGDELHKAGGCMVKQLAYSAGDKPAFGPLVSQLSQGGPQGLLIITSAFDAALIAQHSRLIGWQTNFFGCGWTLSESLIENGGKAVEGMSFVSSYDANSQATAFVEFQKKYNSRFKQMTSFMAKNAYEAMMVLAAALEKTQGRAKGLDKALPGISIDGLTEKISLDAYGDGVRTHYKIVVQNGKFVTKGQLAP